MNNWNSGNYTFFTNSLKTVNLDSINHIIFDLRNNGGGDEFEAIHFISLFIDKPCIYNNESYQYKESLIKESRIIVPSDEYNLNNKNIGIITNRKTACASEIFIANMKKYTSSFIIGKEKTAGAYAGIFIFELPLNITMMVNILSKKEWPDYQIENKGIDPDIFIYPYTVSDMYPHEDKILKQTIDYLNIQCDF